MENQPLEEKNITISDIKILDWGIKISDENKLVYNIPQYKKGTQETTKAYEKLSSYPNLGLNQQICVKFATVPNNNNGKSRYVRIVSEPQEIKQQQNIYTSPQYPNKEEPKYIKGDDGIDWDQISWGKCKHAYLVEAFKDFMTRTSDGVDDTTKIEQMAEQWADMSMRDTRKTQTQNKLDKAVWADKPQTSEPTPPPIDDNDINVSEIPF